MRVGFGGRSFELLPGETVLSGLERQGVAVPAFCRTGVCQTCVLRATQGRPPPRSQVGLAESWAEQGCFLACQCVPDEPLEAEPYGAVGRFDSRVTRVEALSADVLGVRLEAPAALVYRAGQYLQLERRGVTRPYSLASTPGSAELELHVRRFAGGSMSEWLAGALGEPVTLRGPFGECFYFDHEPQRPLLLAGTGTGLAPLLGVVRAALAAGHQAPIHLYHGSATVAGLYLRQELSTLAASAPRLQVTCSVLAADEDAADAELPGCPVIAKPLDRLILDDPLDFADCRVYLCGNPELVARLRQRVYLSGAPRARIHCDAFVAPAAPAGG
jgi:NAD(P)H-flavin reductase